MENSGSDDVVVIQQFAVPAEVLWRALTDARQMRSWFFEAIPEFQAQVGFAVQFDVDTGERVFTHNWSVVEVDPGRRLAYEWSYHGYPGSALATFELQGNAEQCRLTLIFQVLENFPDSIPEFTRESCEGGWHFLIQHSLPEFVGRQP